MMPGTKMRHVGVTDPAEQDLILSYLESISN
jgi:cytochrome c